MEKLFKQYSASQWKEGIDEWIIGRNAVRNREILTKKIINGVSFYDLSTEYGLSLKRVKTIVRENAMWIVQHFD